MSFQLIDALFRSRLTVLSLLNRRGYNVTPFERFSTREVELMYSKTNPDNHALDFRVEKTDPEDKSICHVLYYPPKRQTKFLDEFIDALKLSDDELAKSEFFVILQDEIQDAHHKAAMKYWITRKLKVHFYYLYRLVNNPLDHALQPKFELVPQDKHSELLEAINCKSKGQLPILRYHNDVVTRCLGLVPGDIVKITRPSETVGESIVYSVCL